MEIKNKKGVFFTFVGLFFIIVFITIIFSKNQNHYTEKSLVISTRLNTINNFIIDLEKDLDRELFIGGYRALLSLNTHVRNEEGFIDNLDEVFTNILINGTYNDSEFVIMTQSGQGADFKSWNQRINEEANKLNIITNFEVNDVQLYHSSPWNVVISINLSLLIEDSKQLAKWNYTKTYEKEISILGFEDPLYSISTLDKVTNLINYSASPDFVNDATNDTAVLVNHLNNSIYITSTNGPSFLMRFVGNLSPSEFGIESLVDLVKLNQQSIVLRNSSVVDYLYFNENVTSDWCSVQNMPDWFRIDKSHGSDYEIDILEKKSC
ncbi:hypothetical protein HOD20_02805 [archaeon]|jgi:hypothetical protein|nr:hypothetical protein [archaeon]MBT4351435.1 hypothetical protein [archaeon]MBT4647274.1 hypothetical protein [archaeon]MBT6821163.1 hypothetical protein [archaeon]MBT7391669.1 hypothetical protein [archaeon]